MITKMKMMMITIVMMMIMKRQKIRKVIFVVRALKMMMIMMEGVDLLTMMLASRSSGLYCSRAVRTAMRKPVGRPRRR